MVYPCIPQFYYIKVGYKGVYHFLFLMFILFASQVVVLTTFVSVDANQMVNLLGKS